MTKPEYTDPELTNVGGTAWEVEYRAAMGQSGEEFLANDTSTRTGYPQDRLLYPADITRPGDNLSHARVLSELAGWFIFVVISLAIVLGTKAYEVVNHVWKAHVRSGKLIVKTSEKKL